ncbi:YhdP family protein [Pseudooceanicola spongiae]|uniref:YhdP central domain-containing protein n=1 Tax=Pseudooceanicola spongiae TaxID=2613965 RepID=A0A7L9WL90_9RHOB|nr:DUF3971 domain-containing protein [Pseudooceanicola spongiae]QOL79820.1 hypothetical protein F3W81_02680 [Pseudooceanicola spongiae]
MDDRHRSSGADQESAGDVVDRGGEAGPQATAAPGDHAHAHGTAAGKGAAKGARARKRFALPGKPVPVASKAAADPAARKRWRARQRAAAESASETTPATEHGRMGPRRYHHRRKAHWTLRSCSALILLSLRAVFAMALVILGVTTFYVAGDNGRLEVPEWLRAEIERKIEAQTPGLEVGFQQLSLVVEHGWQPRVQLSGVTLAMGDGRTRLTLADMSARMAMEPLLLGRLQPREIMLSGVHLRVRRNADGDFDVVSHSEAAPLTAPAGEDASAAEAGRDVAEAMEELKDLLGTPALSRLRRIDGQGLTMVYEDLRAARRWSLDGGRLSLSRDGDNLRIGGDFALLGGRSYATVIDTSYTTTLSSRAGQFALSVQDMPAADLATQSPALAWLGVLDAPLSGALRVSLDETGAVGPLNATLQIGAGVLQPTQGAKPIPFNAARTYFTYDPASQSLRFSELSVDSHWVQLEAEGELKLTGGEGAPVALVGQLRASDVVADPADLFPEPVHVEGAQLDLQLQLEPFRLSLGALTLRQGDQRMVLRGDMAADAGGWGLHLDGHMDAIEARTLLSYWPPSAVGKTRDWIDKNVQSGTLENLQLGVRATDGGKPDIYLGFEFRDLTAKYLKTLPPITGGRGHASLLRNRFVVQADAGQVAAPEGAGTAGMIDIAGSSFVVADVTQKPTIGQINLRTHSQIRDMLALLDEEPFRFLSKANKPVDLASGEARAQAEITLPLIKDLPLEQVKLKLSAELVDVASDQLLPGKTLKAENLSVTGDTGQLKIAGAGTLDGVPFEGGWSTALGKDAKGSEVVASVTLDDRFAKAFLNGLPEGTVAGRGTAQLRVDLPKGGVPAFRLTSDLAGLGLRIDGIGWRLSEAAKGTLEIGGQLSTPVSIDKLHLEAPGLAADGKIELAADGSMAAARFSRVTVGRWLDAPVVLSGRGKGQSPGVAVNGGTFDLRYLPQLPSGGAGGPLSVKFDRLLISNAMRLDGFVGDFSTVGGMQGNFSGRMNGGPVVQGRVIRDKGDQVIRIDAADAGAVIAAAGLLSKGRGGALGLTLRPTGEKGSFDGKLVVKDLSIQDAPAMAALLSSISVVGLLEQMAGQGILFADVEADFRLTPDKLYLRSSSAVGASMGISMDGTYDMGSKAMDMQGVVSPFYVLNGIGSFLTRKGEGLFGMNFTLKGPASAPSVGVNPLSLLTPGMFREIFRRPAPVVPK